MSRMPTPGEDEGVWGDILNDFLAVSHMDDGTIRVSALPEPQVSDGSITPAKLSQAYIPAYQRGIANGVAPLDGSGKVPVGNMPSGFIGADATTSSKGVVRLNGDLSGTADNPTVPGLATKYVKPVGGIPETDLDSNVQTKLNSGGSVGDATSSQKGVLKLTNHLGGTADLPTVPGLATKINLSEKGANNGVATLDNTGKVPTSQLPAGLEPDATTTSKGIIQLAGDLGGTAAAPTVPGKADNSAVVHLMGNETITGVKVFTSSPEVPDPENPLEVANKEYVDAIAVGSPDANATTKGILKLTNDLGGTADLPTVPGLAAKIDKSTATTKGDILAATAASTIARVGVGSDGQVLTADSASAAGVHWAAPAAGADATTSSKGIVQLAGDLGGTAASPTVPGLANKADKTTTISAGTGLTGGGDLSANRTLSVSYGTTAGTAAQGNDSRITGAIQSSTATAKGDLLAATAASTVTRVGVGTDGQVLSADSTQSTGVKWVTPAGTTPDATTSTKGVVQLAGDLGGTAASPTVPGLANKADKTTTISAGTGLTGGGDLSANRTLTVSYGTAAGTAAQGNDSRITGAEQTSNKGAANGYASLDSSSKVPTAQLPATTSVHHHVFSKTGTLIVEAGVHRLYNDSGSTWTIVGIRSSVGTAPTGASLIVDVNVNGTTIFTTQGNRPTIAAAANTSGKVTNMDVTTITNGQYVTVDVDQIGSTVSGSDLTVQLEIQ